MNTSKFTYDVLHRTFCEDTNKSKLIGKETIQYTWREKQKYSEAERRRREEEERTERGTQHKANKLLKAPINSCLSFTNEINSHAI